MLASAVVIPDEPPKPLSPKFEERLSATKRKQSFEISAGTKKPRLVTENDTQLADEPPHESSSSQHLNGTDQLHSSENNLTTQGSTDDITSNIRRSSQLNNLEKERGRNKRFFGGLLSTLSQAGQPAKPRTRHPSSTANENQAVTQQRRADIEAKQAAKLAAQSNAFDEEDRKRGEGLKKQRELEGEIWEERAMGLRHQNERAMTGFFRTKAEPAIYWKPKQLSPAQIDIVGKQKQDTQERVEIERKSFAERKRRSKEKRDIVKLEKVQAQAGLDKTERNETSVDQESSEPKEKLFQDEKTAEIVEAPLLFAKPSDTTSINAKPADTTVLSEVDPHTHISPDFASNCLKEAENQTMARDEAANPARPDLDKKIQNTNKDSKLEADASTTDEHSILDAREDVSHTVQDQEDFHDNDDEQMHGGEGGEDAVIY